MAFQEVGVRAVVKGFAQYQSQMGKMQTSTQKFGGFLKIALKVGAVAAGAAIGLSIKAFADFDAEMTKSLAIMTDVSDKMRDDMAKAARKMALETTFSAKECAESYFFLASAGLDAEQSIAALPVVARFAQAGMFDMALATDLLTDAQSALGLSSSDTAENMENMTRVGDVLVKMNQMANASVEQFATSLKEKGASALRGANIALEEGAGLLAYWADQGLKGSAAGSQLAGMLLMLPKIAVKNADAFKRYSIELFDSSGKLKSFSDIAREFTPMLEGMTDAQRAQAFEQMGINRLLADSILKMKGGADAIDKYTAAAWDAAGATKEVAEKQLKTFNAQMSLLMSVLTDVAIEVGSHVVPALMKLVKWARDDMIPALRDNLKPILAALIPVFIALTAAAIAWGVALIIANAPIILAVAALAALGAAFFLIEQKTGFFSKVALPALKEFGSGLKDVLDKAVTIIKNFVGVFQKHWEQIKTFVEPVLKFIQTQVVKRIELIKGAFDLVIALIHGDWKKAWAAFKGMLLDAITLAISPYVLAWETAKAALTLIWDGIKAGVEGMVNAIIEKLNVFLGALETVLNAMVKAYNNTIGRIPGVSKLGEITIKIGRIDLTGVKKAEGAFAGLEGSIRGFNKAVAKRQAVELSQDIRDLQRKARSYVDTALIAEEMTVDLGAAFEDMGDAAGGAGGKMDEAADSALALRASLELTDAMLREVTVAEHSLADAMGLTDVVRLQAIAAEHKLRDGLERTDARLQELIVTEGNLFGAMVKREDLLRIQIDTLKDYLAGLDQTSEGNKILAEAVQITIDNLQDQIDELGGAEDRLILFGDAIGPVSAAIRDMTDAISGQIDAVKGLLSIQTQEEATREAEVSRLKYEIELLDDLIGETGDLTTREQERLDSAKARLVVNEADLEVTESLLSLFETKREQDERLTRDEKIALLQAIARRKELLLLIEADQALIEEIEAIGSAETKASRAARISTNEKEAELAVVEDLIENIEAEKKARVDELNAMVRGRPTMKEWTQDTYLQAFETGLLGSELENIPPLLRAWWMENRVLVWEVAVAQNHLLLAQQQFTSESMGLADDWGSSWTANAQAIVDAMNEAAGGEPADESYQYGGFVRRTGMAFLHAGEFVVPKYRVEHVWDRTVAPRVPVPAAPAAPAGGGFTANIAVTSQQETAREIERTMRRVAFSLKGAS